jgi:hypothetical protein
MIIRDRSTPERQAFWAHAERCAADVRTWPDWRKAGVNYEPPGVESDPPLAPAKVLP